MKRRAIIIGAGPAGLTAAYELLKRTDITPIVLEKSGDIGGISKTVTYKGNRMDIGGHRFFSKSDRVMNWWMNIMPIQSQEEKQLTITYHQHSRKVGTRESPSPQYPAADPDKVMLVRNRLSRIYFLRKFFSYPIQISLDTLKKLGMGRTASIMLSYTKARLFPRRPERNLEDFFINRFGTALYRLFFKDYTEKVWGVPCTRISAEWGAQRIKGISIAKAIAHAAKTLRLGKGLSGDIGQKDTETSLIEKFLYPKFGPGQLWEEVARQVQEMGGTIFMNQEISTIRTTEDRVTAIEAINTQTGEMTLHEGDYFFSTMPVKDLISGMGDVVPSSVREVAAGLQYRDFITVGVLLKRMVSPKEKPNLRILPDTWIYIQEKHVKVGRIQIFNNWSPYMVKDINTIWIGLEYFCNKTDEFWNQSDSAIQVKAIQELEKMGLARREDVLDSTVLRMEKTYPAYFGTYSRFDEIRQFTDHFVNLFLVGRNGMHKYNNSDHSMLTAMVAVDNMADGVISKENIWAINTEQDYHEEKAAAKEKTEPVTANKESVGYRESLPAGLSVFYNYLLKDKDTKWYRWAVFIGIILQLIIFKYFYPYAGFINGDSYVYLQAAAWNFDINTYPVGYSKFLRIFSSFTTSDTALVAFQYIFLQLAALYLLFTLFYFFRPSLWLKITLCLVILFNPLFLYLSNYVSSDAIFTALSLLWFTQLIWFMHHPTGKALFWHAIILFLAFTVRYNALYYPLISTVAFLISRQTIYMKLASIVSSMILISLFIVHTGNAYKQLAGVREFSPFSGWQVVNNALYAYRYVEHKDTVDVPEKYRSLDRAIRTYFDTTRDVNKHPEETAIASTMYMWAPQSPLQKYMNNQFKNDSMAGPIRRWSTVAPLYAAYGYWLIKTYPMEFGKHYLLPNTLKYYIPPMEFLETYNMGVDSIEQIAQEWFRYKSKKVKTAFQDYKVTSLSFYPILAGVMNVIFLSAIISFLFLSGSGHSNYLTLILPLPATLWIVNFGFSVFASPIALRFQIFPITVFTCFGLILLDSIRKMSIKTESR